VTIIIFDKQYTKPSPHLRDFGTEIPGPGFHIRFETGLQECLGETFPKRECAIVRTSERRFNALLEFILHSISSLHHS